MAHDIELQFLEQHLRFVSSEITSLASREWSTCLIALVFGVLSSISFPIGAIIGVYFSPVNEHIVAGLVAFGAGALLFAVTVELYGVRIALLERENYHDGALEVTVLAGFAMLGAWGYLLINRWLNNTLSEDDETEQMPLIDSTGEVPLTTQRTNISLMSKRTARSSRMQALMFAASKVEKKKKLAMAMWLGVLVDGVAESILLGFLAAEQRLSLVMVLSLFVANFPESFSGSSMMKEASPNLENWKIIGLWTVLTLMTGSFAYVACMAYPVGDVSFAVHIFSAAIEGVAGGAMLALIAAVMLPGAYEMQGDIIGLVCVTGFLLAVLIKVYGGVASEITSGTWAGKHNI